MDKKKLYISAIVSVVLGIMILFTSIYLIKSLNAKDKSEFEDSVTNALYIEDNKTSTTTTKTTSTESTKETNSTTKTTTTTKTTNTTKTKTTTTKRTEESKKYTEDDVVNFAKNTYSSLENDKSIKETVKESFIKLVDFIFYDGEILGHKFKDLTDSAKSKIIYYTLKADKYIDQKVPGYKDKVKDKTNDLKSKLVAKYMEVATKICNKNTSACQETKSNLEELKKDVKISWDIVSKAVKYGAGKAKDLIKNWYEIFSGKA